uniref:Spore coat protein n=1 Tax=Thermogemmatispora argillosa TaxID=2045280 RepID=A0A455T8I0_9CHLR|nr:spore coat protein [Thermogemmatispora argillosa]
MTTRRQLLKMGAVLGLGSLLPLSLSMASRVSASVRVAQTPLPGAEIPQFVEPLPTFAGARVSGSHFQVRIVEFQQRILPASLYARLRPPFNAGTYVWGYQVDGRPPHYPGYTVEARHGVPMVVTYVNALPLAEQSKLLPLLTVDQTIHWADPQEQMGSMEPFVGAFPVVVHLHGGENSSAFDGAPEAWFTADGRHGKGYSTYLPTAPNAAVYWYPNQQPATTLWFHDHTLGVTRLTLFSGLAAFYLIRDAYDTGQPNNPLGLPAGAHEIELMIQDRQFDTRGQLLFPDGTPPDQPTGLNGPPPNPSIHPYWIPEFFGDVIVVNGKAWPYLNVEPRRYRFRFLNASNARFFQMRLIEARTEEPGPIFWQIGTDGGLLDRPVKLNDPQDPASPALLLAPGERADVLIDFAPYAGRTLLLTNSAPAPFPDGDPPDPATTGRVMQIRVAWPLKEPDTTYDPAHGLPLRGWLNRPPAIVRLANPTTGTLAAGVKPEAKRLLVLVEVEGPGGPVEVLLNNTKWSGVREGSQEPVSGAHLDRQGQGFYLTELPRVGATEIWEIANLTEDAHPIHIHLVQFQLLNRQALDVDGYRAHYDSLFPGGTYNGLRSDGSWGPIQYPPGVFIPGYGPPLPYSRPNAAGALGGNPDITPYLRGPLSLPEPGENGWKDTIRAYPGQVTRLVVRWAPITTPVDGVRPGQNLYPFDPTRGPGYVWHCHILDHEDNEMMRPYLLAP